MSVTKVQSYPKISYNSKIACAGPPTQTPRGKTPSVSQGSVKKLGFPTFLAQSVLSVPNGSSLRTSGRQQWPRQGS